MNVSILSCIFKRGISHVSLKFRGFFDLIHALCSESLTFSGICLMYAHKSELHPTIELRHTYIKLSHVESIILHEKTQ